MEYGLLFFIIFIIIVFTLAVRSNKPRTLKEVRERKSQKAELQRQQHAREEELQRQQQTKVDDKVDREVKRLYKHYGEEWINNAGRSRLAMAIDEMLGPAPRRDSNAARAQRTLAAAVLETVLARKMETVRQQQGASEEGQQTGIVVDPMLAADIVDTAVALTEDAHYINEVDDVGDIDDTDLDDIDDVDLDID